MFIVDDPLLALIVRFVVNENDVELSDEAFIQRQILALQEYLAEFPAEQRNAKAMEWIAERAEIYRRQWQNMTLPRLVRNKRCADCPLRGVEDASHCEIHGRWVSLLTDYASNKVTSREYIEYTLKLLSEHKTRLRVRNSPVLAEVRHPVCGQARQS